MSRVLVVANRLPVTIKVSPGGDVTLGLSSGGLVSALLGTRSELEFLWIGWPGQTLPLSHEAEIVEKLRKEHGCVPVLLPQQLAEAHYNGVSNGEGGEGGERRRGRAGIVRCAAASTAEGDNNPPCEMGSCISPARII